MVLSMSDELNLRFDLLNVSPGKRLPDVVNVIVEIPKGRRSKFEVDKETGLMKLDRYLYSSSHYPGDYGFIPQTLAEDGDALDALIMVNEATFPGCLIESRVVGLFRMQDRTIDRSVANEPPPQSIYETGGHELRRWQGCINYAAVNKTDCKILGVPDSGPLFGEYRDLADVPSHFLKEVEHFFLTYKQLEGAEIRSDGWQDALAGGQEIKACRERWRAVQE
jgi:inorganic pyrophosphatase